MDEQFLESVIDAAFKKLGEVGGDPRGIPQPFRTVAVVASAQGVIDNGGLRYFFESDWPGQPPYSLFSEAYREIGAQAEADVLDAAVAALAVSRPEQQRAVRLELLDGSIGRHIEGLDAKMTSDIPGLLESYARKNLDALGLG